MGLLLQIDDLEPGMYCAALGRTDEVSEENTCREKTEPKTISGRSIPSGAPFVVLATSLPFVLFAYIGLGGAESGVRILDVRNVALCRMSDEFIEALVGPSEDPEDNKPF